jgi:aminopeptidase-like protein
LDLHTQQQADLMQWLLILAYQDGKVDNLDLANQAINKVKSRIVYKR